MYKISIILATFNVGKYIKRCFNSLLAQTIGFSNIQIIFVDDCSTDNSCKIIDKYAEDYENVISIHLHTNSGAAGKPRNEGIKFAFADYLLFLDPDDILMPDACEVLYKKIIESDVDIVAGGYKKQNWVANWKSVLNDDETLIENPKENLSIYFNPPGLAAKLFKKEFIIKNKIKFPKRLPAQDLVFLTESYLNANTILSLNNFIVFEYCVRKDDKNKSVTQNITKEYLYGLLEAYALVFNLFEEFNVNNLLRKLYFTKNHFNFLRVQLNQLKISKNEIKEIYSSELFLKMRNQKFIMEDENLDNFFYQLIENHESVEGKTLQQICRQTKTSLINSNGFTPEIAYKYNKNKIKENNTIYEIEKELYSFIKRNSTLYNMIEDSKK